MNGQVSRCDRPLNLTAKMMPSYRKHGGVGREPRKLDAIWVGTIIWLNPPITTIGHEPKRREHAGVLSLRGRVVVHQGNGLASERSGESRAQAI